MKNGQQEGEPIRGATWEIATDGTARLGPMALRPELLSSGVPDSQKLCKACQRPMDG